MDVSNIAYPVGLVFGVLFGASGLLTGRTIENLKTIANSERPMRLLYEWRRVILLVSCLLFLVGLFLPQYISVMGLFSLYFGIFLFGSYFLGAINWLKHETLSIEWIITLTFVTCMTSFIYGGYTAQQQAFYATTKYNLVTKSGAFSNVRIVRASSSGFIISSDRTILFIPAGEVRYVMTLSGGV
jgi:hypothetical protein